MSIIFKILFAFTLTIIYNSIKAKIKLKGIEMGRKATKKFITGGILIFLFIILTCLCKLVNVKPLGVNGTSIGFSTINVWFHNLIGVHLWLYFVTDWAGLIPIFIGVGFAIFGVFQLIKRKNLFKVDCDILILGVYYVVLFAIYFLFEKVYINYRPILINGIMEKSYPSSTILLAVGMICPFIEQISRRVKNKRVKIILCSIFIAFIIFMVGGRLLSGVHWLTDVIGSLLLSFGVYLTYKGFVLIAEKKKIS